MSKILTKEFNALKTNNCVIQVRPEVFNNGGFIVINSLDKQWCKTIRFVSQDDNITKFPIFPENLDEWLESADEIYECEQRIQTLITTYGYTPKWCSDELEIFRHCFTMFDINCSKINN
jgi:hypothetical protein